jgi:site-specific recombinase XerD
MNIQPIVQQTNIEPVRHYIENALSSNSRKAYKADLAHYRAWGGIVPATSEMIATYMTDHAESLSVATLQRRLVAIAKAHSMQSLPDPTKNDLVKMAFQGIRRLHGKPQRQVSPLLKDDLTVILSHIPNTTKGSRDAALLLLGFCSALRRSELSALRCTDLEFTSQGIHETA